MPDHKPTEDTPEKPENADASEETGEKKKPLDYDFKIVPVDPKNSFDFEDVADK